jgi:hypothetical protein
MGFLVQFDNIVHFDVFMYTLHVSGIYHPSSGASLQSGAVGFNNLSMLVVVITLNPLVPKFSFKF